MGPPKNRWTETEEEAFKAGIAKYGIGKWSDILKDPELKIVLRSRTNVNLKDKWRNMNSMASGSGSRCKASPCKNNKQTSSDEGNAVALGKVAENDTEVPPPAVYSETPEEAENDTEAPPPAVYSETPQEAENDTEAPPPAVYSEKPEEASSETKIARLDDLILEAITKLKEPRGSSRATIIQYLEECQLAPSDFKKKLAANLKILTEAGRLVKVKRHYKIAPSSMSLDVGEDPFPSLQEETHREVDISKIRILTNAEVDAELEAMRRMTPEEAAAVAVRAIEEAEAAIAAAEEAEREAVEAEAKAEAAWRVAEAEMKSFKNAPKRARTPGGKNAKAFCWDH